MADYYDEYWQRRRPPPCDDPLASRRRELLAAALARAPAASILDAGCGTGDLVASLHAEGRGALGMDVSARAVSAASAAHPQCRFVQHSLEELPWPFAPASFDVVVSFEVIEHLVRPRRLLQGAREVLRPGGHLAITTPYHGLVKNVALAALRFDRHFDVEGDHLRFFSDRALRRLLAQTGFEPVLVRHFGRRWPLSAGVFIWARRS